MSSTDTEATLAALAVARDIQQPNLGTLRIDICGATAIGKSLVAAIIAKALAEAFAGREESHGLDALAIEVVNGDGDWAHVLPRADLRPPIAPHLKRIVIVDANGYGGFEYVGQLLDARTVAQASTNIVEPSIYKHSYVGPWNEFPLSDDGELEESP